MLSETDYAGHAIDNIQGYDKHKPLVLSPEEREIALEVYRGLRVVYASVRENKQHSQLVALIMRLFAMTPFGTRNDQVTQTLKVEAWVDEFEKYPLWAVKKAFDWDKESQVEVTFGMFKASVLQACGREAIIYRGLHEILK